MPPNLFGGPSRLLYDILCAYKDDNVIDVSVLKNDCCEIVLPPNINFVKWSEISYKKKNGSPFYQFLKIQKKLTEYRDYIIKAKSYDLIIGFSYTNLCFNFEGFNGKFINIGMDSATLLFLRGIINHKNLKLKIGCLIRLFQVIRTEKYVSKISSINFTVGKFDADFYNYLYNAKSIYIPHPYNKLTDGKQCVKWNGEDKLRLCFAGDLSPFYSGNLICDLLNDFCKNSDLKDCISIYYLGKQHYRTYLDKMTNLGYEVSCCDFVESFEDYLCNTHILVAPIMVGAGTKNRIINALALGLDILTTNIGAENVYGISQNHIANTANEYIEQIRYRLYNKQLFMLNEMQKSEMKKFHSQEQWTNNFWNVITNL